MLFILSEAGGVSKLPKKRIFYLVEVFIYLMSIKNSAKK